jgi:hypothetical protein
VGAVEEQARRLTPQPCRILLGESSRIGLDELRGEAGLECAEAMGRLGDAIERIEAEIRVLKGSIEDALPRASSLQAQLEALFVEGAGEAVLSLPKRSQSDVRDSSSIAEQPATPPHAMAASLPDDFASTPTLEQLGLSGRTMALVGARSHLDAAASCSVSDTEYESSFLNHHSHQGAFRSPLPSAGQSRLDHSFSSDVSVPQFRIVHSSSPSSTTNGQSDRTWKPEHPLSKNVTNASDSSLVVDAENMAGGANSSFMLVDENEAKTAAPTAHSAVRATLHQ